MVGSQECLPVREGTHDITLFSSNTWSLCGLDAVPHGKQRAPVFLLLSSLHCLDTLKQGRVAESSLQGVLVSMPGARTALALTSTASTSQRPGCM